MQENEEQKQEKRGIRELFEELDAIAVRLEDRETSLEESFQLYREGMELLKECGDRLDTVEKKMLEISEDGSFREFSK